MRADVARCGEAGAQIGARVFDGDDGPGFLGGVDTAAGGKAVIDMCVRVDQPGEDGGLAEVDDLRALEES